MKETTDEQRRRLMLVAGISVVTGAAVTMWRLSDMTVSYPHGSPLAVDIGDLPVGELRTVEWQGRPIWILRRSAADIAALAAHEQELIDPNSLQSLQPPYCSNRQRSLTQEIFIAIGLCTHRGCSPALIGAGGFLCPCHTSRFDLAGRVFKAGPATANLVIPAYRFEAENKLLLGAEA